MLQWATRLVLHPRATHMGDRCLPCHVWCIWQYKCGGKELVASQVLSEAQAAAELFALQQCCPEVRTNLPGSQTQSWRDAGT